MNIINWLLGLEDVKWFMESGLSPEQKVHASHLLKVLLLRVVLLAGFGGSVIGYIGLVGFSNASNTTLVPGQPTDTNIMVPATAGNTNALTICKDGIVSKGQVHVDGGSNPDVQGYVAVLGPERLTYTDNPPGGKNLVVILNGNSQTVQPEVIECLLKRAK